MITRPLDLESRLNRPPRDWDFMHWVSVAGIGLFFTLAGSRFVLAPGVLVGTDEPFRPIDTGANAQYVQTAPEVISYRRDNIILFQGGVYKRLVDLKQPLEEYAARHRGSVLPVLADQQVSMQSISELAELARAAGFGNVLLLGQTDPRAAKAPGN